MPERPFISSPVRPRGPVQPIILRPNGRPAEEEFDRDRPTLPIAQGLLLFAVIPQANGRILYVTDCDHGTTETLLEGEDIAIFSSLVDTHHRGVNANPERTSTCDCRPDRPLRLR